MSAQTDLIELIDQRIAASRTATVAMGTVANRISDSRVNVTFDGSAVPMAVAVFGDVNLYEGDRVSLMRNGHTWIVMGTFTRRVGVGTIGTMYAVAGGLAAHSVSFSEDAVDSAVWAQEPQFRLLAGYIYRVHGVYQIATDNNLSVRGQYMIRKGRATTSGTMLQRSYLEPPQTAGRVASIPFEGFIKNTSATDVVTYLTMTVVQDTGSASCDLYGGDAATPLWVSVDEIGTIDANPSTTPMAREVS